MTISGSPNKNSRNIWSGSKLTEQNEMEIRKAQRKKAKLRLGIAAPSGAGKTYSALLLAFGIGGKVGVIDTEHGSADLYEDLGDYDIINIEAPYTVQKYRDALTSFEKSGYNVVIMDSLSHAWAGDGGLLDKQGKLADRPGANGYAAWRTITPEHNGLVESILTSPCHIIATMRSKQEYVLEVNDKGKQTPRKVGMAPVQREGMEYEFTVMLDIDMSHVSSSSKDRTRLFDGQLFKIERKHGELLRQWLETGIEPPVPASAEQGVIDGVSAGELADWTASIEAAATLEDLKTVFGNAALLARNRNDKLSYDAFVAAKNTRKQALEGATA
jgi:hypothetical protein